MKERGNSTCVPKASRCILTERAQIAVTRKAAGAARPGSACRLVFVPTSGTAARCSSFGAGEARDVGLFAFVGEVVDVLAVFPQGHALVMMPSAHPVAHTVRVADEKAADLLLDAEVNDLPLGLVPQVTNASCTGFAFWQVGPVACSVAA